MANKQLFDTRLGYLPTATEHNAAGGPAYRYDARHQLAQLVMTGCMNQTFYAAGEAQLADVLALAKDVDDVFLAKAAIYGRRAGYMKDMPALLLAALAANGSPFLAKAFSQIVDNGRMLRNFVQILRSGVTGRKSLGTRPKKLVQAWLNQADERKLLQAALGNQPSLADVLKMVHPKPAEAWREAFFAWVIGKPCDAGALPAATQALLSFRAGQTDAVPPVPFQWLSNESLTSEQWLQVAKTMGWQALRQALNMLARKGVFELPGAAACIAARLADPQLVRKARAYPYQLLSAYRMASSDIPAVVREALQEALDLSLVNVPRLEGRVAVCVDVSGSMHSPVTGYRRGATTSVRCIDVAALMAAAVLRKHPDAQVLPFDTKVVGVRLNPRDSVLTNAEKLAAVGGGATACSAPLAKLVKEKALVDTVVLFSDNQSWIDKRHHGATETLRQWALLKWRNPQARLVCIDLQPYGNTQVLDREDVLNVGGFGDSVFDVMASFATNRFDTGHWVDAIEQVQL